MTIIDTNGRMVHLGDLAATGSLYLATSYKAIQWAANDIVLAPSGTKRLQLTTQSGEGCWIEIRKRTTWLGQYEWPIESAALFSYMDAEENTQLWCLSSDGMATQLTSHSHDAPDWMYDVDDPFPRVTKELNQFIGKVRYTNVSRATKLLEALVSGADLSSLAAEKKCVHIETFAEHNSRLGLTGGKRLQVLDWPAVQEEAQKQYDKRRQEAIARGETPAPEKDIRQPIPKWIADRLSGSH
ncbi:MAG: hypothetical protein HZA90_21875 [Verrucomicrobia bacterium]|nr:hypothetical protein [Verrucomicrobiota bacterium]